MLKCKCGKSKYLLILLLLLTITGGKNEQPDKTEEKQSLASEKSPSEDEIKNELLKYMPDKKLLSGYKLKEEKQFGPSPFFDSVSRVYVKKYILGKETEIISIEINKSESLNKSIGYFNIWMRSTAVSNFFPSPIDIIGDKSWIPNKRPGIVFVLGNIGVWVEGNNTESISHMKKITEVINNIAQKISRDESPPQIDGAYYFKFEENRMLGLYRNNEKLGDYNWHSLLENNLVTNNKPAPASEEKQEKTNVNYHTPEIIHHAQWVNKPGHLTLVDYVNGWQGVRGYSIDERNSIYYSCFPGTYKYNEKGEYVKGFTRSLDIMHPVKGGNVFKSEYNEIGLKQIVKYNCNGYILWSKVIESDAKKRSTYSWNLFSGEILVHNYVNKRMSRYDDNGKIIYKEVEIETDSVNSLFTQRLNHYAISKNGKYYYRVLRSTDVRKECTMKIVNLDNMCIEKSIYLEIDFIKYPVFENVDTLGNMYFSDDHRSCKPWLNHKIPYEIIILNKDGKMIDSIKLMKADECSSSMGSVINVDYDGNVYQMRTFVNEGINVYKWARIKK